MRGYAALDSDRPLQDDRSLVLSAVDSMVSESLVQTTSHRTTNSRRGGRKSNRERLRYTYDLCICACVKFVCSLPNWWCYTVTLEGVWSDNFFLLPEKQHPGALRGGHVASAMPVCYVRRGNLLLHALVARRMAFRVCHTRCDGNWGWNCTFWIRTPDWINNKANGSSNWIKGRF